MQQSAVVPIRRPHTNAPQVIGYLRVSTGMQDLENQKLGILQPANSNHWKVFFVQETVSGAVSYTERELGKIIATLRL